MKIWHTNWKKEFYRICMKQKCWVLGWVYCRPMKELFVKISASETAKKKVSRLKNTNNHALKYWPFYEGEGLTSGFIKKKKKDYLWLKLPWGLPYHHYSMLKLLISKEKAYNLKTDRIHTLKTVMFLTEDIHVTRICNNFKWSLSTGNTNIYVVHIHKHISK